jgi:organic radical activating enzyme
MTPDMSRAMRQREPVGVGNLRHRYLDPNFTAILPGKCQARCRFCLEPEGPPPPSLEAWLESFEALVTRELPPTFRTVSISGGEPTLSPVFEPMLRILTGARASRRIARVVLTTNGNAKGLTKHMDAIGAAVTNVNISRHAADDLANARVFKTHNVPDADQLRELIAQLSRRGVPANLNCVYSQDHAFGRLLTDVSREELRAEAEHYITFARTVGATSVVFRHDHRVWAPDLTTALEAVFADYAEVHRTQCESCRVVGKVIRGMPVNFKQSAHETVDLHMDVELYELVLHSDGTLHRDWSRRHPIRRPLEPMLLPPDLRGEVGRHAFASSGPPMFLQECEPAAVSCGLLTALPDAIFDE